MKNISQIYSLADGYIEVPENELMGCTWAGITANNVRSVFYRLCREYGITATNGETNLIVKAIINKLNS